MSRLHERNHCMRWKNPTLRKSHSFYSIPTSEEEIPTFCRPQLSAFLLPIAHHHLPLNETCMRYCMCAKQCSRRKPSSLSYESQDTKVLKCMDCSEPQQMQKNLELHLTGTQVEEALAEDKQTVLIQYLDLCTAGLEALVQYGQSLHVSQLAVCRVLNVSHRLVLPQTYPTNSNSDSTHLTMQLQQLESQKQNKLIILKDLIEHCSKNIVLPKHLYELINVNYIKKRNFCIAAKNFRKFLSNSKLSIPQMEKLNQQYNNILNDYQQTRQTLDLELPKAINIRLTILRESFEKFGKFYDNINDNEIVTLLRLIGEKLNIDNSDSVSRDQLLIKPEICEKCKINCINEK